MFSDISADISASIQLDKILTTDDANSADIYTIDNPPPKKIEKNESFEQILRESMISRYWNWNMKMRRCVVLTSRE